MRSDTFVRVSCLNACIHLLNILHNYTFDINILRKWSCQICHLRQNFKDELQLLHVRGCPRMK